MSEHRFFWFFLDWGWGIRYSGEGRKFLGLVAAAVTRRDLYDRKVIGWAFSADMETVHTAIPARETAFANRKTR
jgi:transposase InsO family protein